MFLFEGFAKSSKRKKCLDQFNNLIPFTAQTTRTVFQTAMEESTLKTTPVAAITFIIWKKIVIFIKLPVNVNLSIHEDGTLETVR